MANSTIFDDQQPEEDPGSVTPETPNPETPSSPEGSNRNFLIIAIVLGGIVLLSLICMAVYAFFVLPGQKSRAQATLDANSASITETAMIDAQTQVASLFTSTPAPSDTPVPLPTETLVVVFASESPTVAPSVDPLTATVQALQTQLAVSQATAGNKSKSDATGTPAATKVTTPGTPGTKQLAKTGFADEVGLPGMLIAAIIVIAIMLLARRLRQAH